MKPGDPINIDDFAPLSKLVKGYELDPTKIYLIVLDGKDFRSLAAYNLMNDIRQMHPDINIAIIASIKPNSIEVREKRDGSTLPSTPDGDGGNAGGSGGS